MVLYGLSDDYFHTVKPQMESVTLDDIKRIAGESLRPDHLQILVVGDLETVEPGLRQLGLPVVMLDGDGAVIG